MQRLLAQIIISVRITSAFNVQRHKKLTALVPKHNAQLTMFVLSVLIVQIALLLKLATLLVKNVLVLAIQQLLVEIH